MTIASTPSVLAMRNITLATEDKKLVANLTWRVQSGEFWCVIGKNGVGKSTLLHAIAGLHTPRFGQIAANGQDVATMSVKAQAHWRGLLLQTQNDVFSSTVMDAVLAGRYPYQTGWGWENDDDIALMQSALNQVGLAGYEHKNILQLSGGERQRVALATVLVQQPQLFLLDEPTAHQDVAAQIMIMALIRNLAKEHAVVAVCHDINLVARYATHALVITDKHCYAGTVADVLTPSILAAAYGCEFDLIKTANGSLFQPVILR